MTARWGELEEDFPFDDDPADTRYTVVVDGEVAGMVQYFEEADPDARHADVDIFLGPRHQEQGLGTDAMRTIVRHLLEDRGHHRLTLSADVDNARAIRCYEKAGFRPVGVTHASARIPGDPRWRDELLMELVARPDTIADGSA